MYGCSVTGEGMCDEDCFDCSGKCGLLHLPVSNLVLPHNMDETAEEAAEFDSLDDVTEETLHETLNETEAAAE